MATGDFVDVFGGLFEESDLGRRATFETLLSQLTPPRVAGLAPASPVTEFNRQAFSNRFGSTFNRFLGQLGQQVLKGDEPMSFAEYLQNNFSGRSMRRAPARETGRTTSNLVSPTRFLYR